LPERDALRDDQSGTAVAVTKKVVKNTGNDRCMARLSQIKSRGNN